MLRPAAVTTLVAKLVDFSIVSIVSISLKNNGSYFERSIDQKSVGFFQLERHLSHPHIFALREQVGSYISPLV